MTLIPPHFHYTIQALLFSLYEDAAAYPLHHLISRVYVYECHGLVVFPGHLSVFLYLVYCPMMKHCVVDAMLWLYVQQARGIAVSIDQLCFV
jgi:hypothetical protein